MSVDMDERAPAATFTAVREKDAVTGKPCVAWGAGVDGLVSRYSESPPHLSE